MLGCTTFSTFRYFDHRRAIGCHQQSYPGPMALATTKAAGYDDVYPTIALTFKRGFFMRQSGLQWPNGREPSRFCQVRCGMARDDGQVNGISRN